MTTPAGPEIQIPVLVVRGGTPGQTVVALGGVHGDEYEGMDAVRNVFRGLDPGELAGTFVGVPVCNPPAFAAGTRTSPLDGQNLARVFPGRPDGTASERIAHAIDAAVIRHADFLIDLHSSGTNVAMPLLVGYDSSDTPRGRRSREAARHFGIATVWGHPTISPGRSMSEAHTRGVPWLYTESPSGGWLHSDIAEVYHRGVLSVLRLLGMLPGDVAPTTIVHELRGEGDIDRSITSPAAGFLVPRVRLLAPIRAGAVLGVVEDLAGDVVATIPAPAPGIVALIRRTARVAEGDLAFFLTDEV
jgi:predicted deacylase